MATKIEWCDESINPLGWGCYGPDGTRDDPKPCPYCYAKRMANRHLRDCPLCNQFIPHWHPEQLELVKKWKRPRRIFVQSMGDLFHSETPQEHIDAVLETVRACPQHTFMFLTKNPVRYIGQAQPKNAWFGTSASNATDLHVRQDQMCFSLPTIAFLSLEPLLEGVSSYIDFDVWDWIIVGAQTGPGAKPLDPKIVESIISARDMYSQNTGVNVPLFLKDNLNWPVRIQEFPEVV